MTVANASGYLIIAGTAQGLFETTFDVESEASWSLSPDNGLEIEIRPKTSHRARGTFRNALPHPGDQNNQVPAMATFRESVSKIFRHGSHRSGTACNR